MGAQTKRPKTKRSTRDKTAQGHKDADIRSPNIRSQGQNVSGDKTSQGQNVQRTKRPRGKTSYINYQIFNNTFSVRKLLGNGPHPCPLRRFVPECFFPWDVFSLGHLVPWDVLSLGTFGPWEVLSLDVLS